MVDLPAKNHPQHLVFSIRIPLCVKLGTIRGMIPLGDNSDKLKKSERNEPQPHVSAFGRPAEAILKTAAVFVRYGQLCINEVPV